MSDLTPELNLALAVDNDDTADYLTTNAGLRGSLNTLDGLFNSATGHNHNGAHQGGNFSSLNISGDLTIGGNFQSNGTLTSLGAAHFPTLNVDGLSTLGTLTVTGGTTFSGTPTFNNSSIFNQTPILKNNVPLASYDADGTTVRGLIERDSGNSTMIQAGSANVIRFVNGANSVQYAQYGPDGSYIQQAGGMTTPWLQSSGWIAAGPNVSGGAGDISANRNNGTGYVFLANSSHYIGFDGSNYVMPTSNLSVGGVITNSISTPSITFNQNGYWWQGIPGVGGIETNGNVQVDGGAIWFHPNRSVYLGLSNGTELRAFGFTAFQCEALNVVHNGAINGSLYVADGVTGITIALPGGNYGVFNKSTRSGASAGEVAIANYLYVPGDIYAGLRMYAMSFNQTSDPALKANMSVITDDDCMGRVRANVPVQTYQLGMPVDDAPQPTPWEIGFSAPDVYAASPEFATLDDSGNPVGLNYANMAALLWGALRQLDARCQAKGI